MGAVVISFLTLTWGAAMVIRRMNRRVTTNVLYANSISIRSYFMGFWKSQPNELDGRVHVHEYELIIALHDMHYMHN